MPDRPAVDSRTRRLLAYLRHNRDQLVVDVAILFAWTVGSAAVFQWLGLPQWLYYLVLFVGVAVYSNVTPNWERPYRPPEREDRR
ncbi:hypothetical protein [Halobacterium yunchengense]|uniref:hypothetical protein n=1 Tax=Halobacterium yunchengense TaxID=3108497 RepID=UPI003008FE16